MARRIRLDLMTAGSGTGNAFDWPGGDGVLDVDATFGGGSVALQKLAASGAWLPVNHYGTAAAVAITANGTANFRAAAGPIRVVATTATAVNASATGVPANIAG
jgi:hypothetical protein